MTEKDWKYEGRIKRRPVNAYVDSEEDTKKPICAPCQEKGFCTPLVPYINDIGARDDNFGRCPHCAAIIPVNEMKYESELEDMIDVEQANKPASFEVVEKRRRVQRNIDKGYEQPEIPKLAGKPDKDLEVMLERGVLVNLDDSNVDQEEY